jgi:hypothetical protein
MLAPHKYLTKKMGNNLKIIPQVMDHGHHEIKNPQCDEDTTLW